MKGRVVAGVVLAGSLLLGCNEAPLRQAPVDAGPGIGGLSGDQAARVVAKVGDRVITLGDFAKAIERMDQFDRLKYQSKERRRDLLEELIDVELLAAEARRLGLDKEPEANDALRMILRDAILADTRVDLPAPAQINEAEVRAYYDSHPDRFSEPERRRVAAVVMKDKKEAEKVLKDALKIKTPQEWGDLVAKYSILAPKQKGAASPAELAGDLGIVGPMSDPKGSNAKVPELVREAAFKIAAVQDIGHTVVEAEGRQFIVRLMAITAPHKRTLPEADRSIRVLLVQEKMAERERALEDELRKKFPVEVDDAALAAVKLPAGVERALAARESPPDARDAGAEPEAVHDGGH